MPTEPNPSTPMPIPRRFLLQPPQVSQPASSTIAPNTTTLNSAFPSASDQPQALTPDSNVVLIVSALVCALICVVGLALVTRCAWLRRRAADHLTVSQAPLVSAKGIDSRILTKLPFHPGLLKPAAVDPGTGTPLRPVAIAPDCAICLTEFAEGDELRVLPQCGHGFHVACIDTWFKTRSSCPSRRRVVVAGETSRDHHDGTRCVK